MSDVWKNKEERKKRAVTHTKLMEKKFPKEIERCIERTKVFSKEVQNLIRDPNPNMEIYIVPKDTVSAIFEAEGKTTVLNFASYKHPGGMFIEGSKAQEECLCHESFLYNVLSSKEDYYAWNQKHLNRAMYLNRALYSPDVTFYRKDEEGDIRIRNVNVITCAAPNFKAAHQYQDVSFEENREILKSRIRFILDIAELYKTEELILGAFGAGVFGQEAILVANTFKMLLPKYSFDRVVFAIIDDDVKNYKKFKAVFKY